MNSVFNINKLLDKSLPLKLIQRFLYLFVTYIMFVHVGKGLPTYCVTRAVGRQPFAANDKQCNQWTLKTLYELSELVNHEDFNTFIYKKSDSLVNK